MKQDNGRNLKSMSVWSDLLKITFILNQVTKARNQKDKESNNHNLNV